MDNSNRRGISLLVTILGNLWLMALAKEFLSITDWWALPLGATIVILWSSFWIYWGDRE